MRDTTVLHLIEARRAHIATANIQTLYRDPEMPAQATDRVLEIRGAAISTPPGQGDLIVSHLDIGWSVLPLLVALRGAFPEQSMVQFIGPGAFGAGAGGDAVNAARASVLSACLALFDRIVVADARAADWLRALGLSGEVPVCVVASEGAVAA